MSPDRPASRNVERPGSESHAAIRPSALKRIVGPMLAGLVIDAIDLATFGPIGLYTGMGIGGAVGYWLAPELGFPARGRWLCALMTGVYCTLPLTGFIPAAAIGAGLSRALLRDDEAADANDGPDPHPVDAIDVEYSSEWDDARQSRPKRDDRA